MTIRKVATSGLSSLIFAVMASAQAAPVQYQFSTSGPVSGAADVVALLAGNSVSGSFTYNSASPLLGQSGALGFEPGFAIYATNGNIVQAFYGISGAVGGRAFSDIVGSVSVHGVGPLPANPALGPRDMITLNAEPTPKVGMNTPPTDYQRQLQGFTVGDYTLVNVRLYWVSGLAGAPLEFLTDSSLPGQLPAFQGRLALDFARTDDLGNSANTSYYAHTVFFDGLTTSAVPEVDTGLLALVGFSAAAAVAKQRKRA